METINQITTDGLNHQETYVLVHGAWAAPYVWNMVRKQLEEQGNRVVAVELPGHGEDQTAAGTLTMDAYVDKVTQTIEGIIGQVILVGHSMAGMIVSGVAEQIPDRIKKMVYIAAYVPKDGESAYGISMLDKQSLLGVALIPSADQTLFDVKKDEATNIFCQDAPDEIKQLIIDHYRPEPAAPFSNPVHVTADKFGTVSKYYISTLMDNGIGHNLQQQMIADAGITSIYTLNSGHCPFLSMPNEVSKILLEIGSIA